MKRSQHVTHYSGAYLPLDIALLNKNVQAVGAAEDEILDEIEAAEDRGEYLDTKESEDGILLFNISEVRARAQYALLKRARVARAGGAA